MAMREDQLEPEVGDVVQISSGAKHEMWREATGVVVKASVHCVRVAFAFGVPPVVRRFRRSEVFRIGRAVYTERAMWK